MPSWKTWAVIAVVAAIILALVFWNTGCATPDQKAAHDDVVAYYEEITSDNVVTAEEMDGFQARVAKWKQTGDDAGWLNTLLVSLGTLASAYAANRVRDRMLWGTPSDPKPTGPGA